MNINTIWDWEIIMNLYKGLWIPELIGSKLRIIHQCLLILDGNNGIEVTNMID